jgi:hypothetical protein
MTIFCQHADQLRYPKVDKQRSRFEDGLLVTFRPGEGTTQIRSNLNACDRFIDIPVQTNIALDHIEEDSPLAHLLMWDIAHALPIGMSIVVLSDREECFFDREYFRASLHKTRESGCTRFQKIAALLAERDRGLQRWSFGIPVGPEDATLLNVVVKRLLDINVDEREIILCGRPGANFKYFEYVRIVGEEITAPPIQISAKKNRIAQEARYENLCMMHDRVFLPLDFIEAINKFGDLFGLQTMQAIYFDDLWCMVPRRYSDASVFLRDRRTLPIAKNRGSRDANDMIAFAPRLKAASDGYGYALRNPLRYKADYCYATGSLYICKRQVWGFAPQNESLHWAEYEDVEHGLRASDLGIPSVINPHAITQSVVGRPLLSARGASFCEQITGRIRLVGLPLQWAPAPRKPLFKITLDQANNSFRVFAEKYALSSGMLFSARASRMRDYLSRFLYSVEAATVDLTAKGVSEFFDDVCKYLSFEQDMDAWRNTFVNQVYEGGRRAFGELTDASGWLQNIVWQRPFGKVFVTTLNDYLPKRSIFAEIGIRLTARSLLKQNGRVFFLQGDYRTLCSMLRNSTPWRE